MDICQQKFKDGALRCKSVFSGIRKHRGDVGFIPGAAAVITDGKIGAAWDDLVSAFVNDKHFCIIAVVSFLSTGQGDDRADPVVADNV